MDFASYVGEATDIHHIFPANYCEQQKYDIKQWNCVINKTPIYARTNRIIGGSAPTKYLSSIERNHGVTTDDLNKYLESHLSRMTLLRYRQGFRDVPRLFVQGEGYKIEGS